MVAANMTLATTSFLLLVPTVLWFTASVPCQSNSTLVFTPTELSQALAMSGMVIVAVSGTRLFCKLRSVRRVQCTTVYSKYT